MRKVNRGTDVTRGEQALRSQDMLGCALVPLDLVGAREREEGGQKVKGLGQFFMEHRIFTGVGRLGY